MLRFKPMSESTSTPEPSRVFIVGCGRSGTTLVQSMLAAHPAVLTFTESHFFDKGFRRYRLWPVPRRALAQRVRDFAQENELPVTDGELDELCTRLQRLAMPDAARALLDWLDDCAARAGRAVWIEKTPAHVMYLPWIERAAPGRVRFVHVVRRAEGVLPSLHKASQQWGRGKTWLECALQWHLALRVTQRCLGQARHHVLFYEQLVAQPEVEARRLLAFLNLDWHDAVVRDHHQRGRSVIRETETWKANNLRQGMDATTLDRDLTALPLTARLAVRGGQRYDSLKARAHQLEHAPEGPAHD